MKTVPRRSAISALACSPGRPRAAIPALAVQGRLWANRSAEACPWYRHGSHSVSSMAKSPVRSRSTGSPAPLSGIWTRTRPTTDASDTRCPTPTRRPNCSPSCIAGPPRGSSVVYNTEVGKELTMTLTITNDGTEPLRRYETALHRRFHVGNVLDQ